MLRRGFICSSPSSPELLVWSSRAVAKFWHCFRKAWDIIISNSLVPRIPGSISQSGKSGRQIFIPVSKVRKPFLLSAHTPVLIILVLFCTHFVLNHHDRQHLIIWLVHFFRHFCHPCISIDQPSIRFWTHVLRRRVAEAPKKAQRLSGLDPKHQIILNSWDIISTQSHSSSQSFTPKTLNILDAIAPPSSYPCQPCHQNGWDKIATITENKFEGSNLNFIYRNSLLVMA